LREVVGSADDPPRWLLSGDSMSTDELKLFCIGLQKTGLTSLLHLMRECGFDARGNDAEQRRNFFRRNYDQVLAYYDSADFFCDWPTPLMYKLLYEKYGPRARFILTVRRDARTWFESLKRHNAYAHPLKNKHRLVFGRYYPHGFEEEHASYYNAHNEEAIRFFRQVGAEHQLLVLRVDQPDAISRISEFVGVPIQRREFPHRNSSQGIRPGLSNRLKFRYNRAIQPIYAKYAPKWRPVPPAQVRPLEAHALPGRDGLT
jgi:sulfotransferase family protein